METVGKILITGGGAPGAPGIINAIRLGSKKTHITSCDMLSETAGKYLADDYFTIPSGGDPSYCETLLGVCKSKEIKKILPITTKELIPLSQHKLLFAENGIDVLVSDYDALSIANDKGKLYAHLKQRGIAIPDFGVAHNYAEFEQAEKALNRQPYIIKPCVGNGSRGFRIISNTADERDLLFNHKPSSTYVTQKKIHAILSQGGFPPLLVSEYMPGAEYTVDCLVQGGQVQLIIPRRRDKMNNGISVAGIIEHNQEVIDYCKNILDVLPLDGPIGIQVKYSVNNEPLIVEINPRIQGTTVACIGAGINIPHLSFAGIPDNTTGEINLSPIKWGTKFIRYYQELYY